jgi:diadenosine tetraphosphate (Ap4A) HIT family hydrolase
MKRIAKGSSGKIPEVFSPNQTTPTDAYHLIQTCTVCDVFRTGSIPSRYEPIFEFSESVAVLAPDQTYRGRCELWLKRHATELHQLPRDLRDSFIHSLAILSEVIQEVMKARKINYELLGNTVPHLHWHVIPRYLDDPLPHRPIWENPHYKELPNDRYFSTSKRRSTAQLLRLRIIEKLGS